MTAAITGRWQEPGKHDNKKKMNDYTIEQLLDLEQIRHLLESHQRLSGMAYALFDTDDNCLVCVGCREICQHFHHANPIADARCRESRALIRNSQNSATGEFQEYRCKNGMIEVAMPLLIDDRHLATFFAGQFFYENDLPDRSRFIKQAEELGFDRDAYLARLDQVPVFSHEHIRNNLLFLHAMVQLLAEMGLKNLRLAQEMEQRKQIDRQLLLLNTALNNSRDAAYLIDEQFRFIYVNDVACRTLGYSREELLSMGIADIDPDLNDEALSRIAQHTRTAGANNIETKHRAKDGRIFPVEVTGTIFEYEGQYYNLALARDISDRKQAEKQLGLLNHALDQIHEGAFLIDEQTRFTYVNQEACRSLEYSRDELLGMTVLDIDAFFTPELAAQHLANLDRQGTLTFETQHRTKSDRIFPVEITTSVFEHAGSRYYLSMVRDIAERKRVEEMLQEREKAFRTLAENSPDSILRYDTACRCIYANPLIEKTLGIPAGSMPGKTPMELFPAGEYREYQNIIEEALRTGRPAKLEVVVPDIGEGVQYHHIRFTAEFSEQGNVTGVLVIGHNITEHKRMEQVLAAREQEFRSLAENSPDNVARWDTNGRYLYINPTHEQTIGITLNDVIGQYISDSHEHVKAAIVQIAATGQEIHVVKQPVVVDGVTQLHDVSLVPEFDANGTVVSVLGIGRDMTVIYRMQDALAAREREFRTLAENAPDNIVRYDTACRMVYANSRLEQTLGVSADYWFGKTPMEISPNGAFREYQERIADVLKNGEETDIDIVLPDTGEGERYHNVRFVAERGIDNQVTGVLAIGRDFTEKRHMQELMIQNEKMVSLGGLAAGIAHELNNPLGIITQAVQNIKRRVSAEFPPNLPAAEEAGISLENLDSYFSKRQINELLDSASVAALRAAQIINSILHFSHSGGTAMQHHKLETVLEQTLELAASDFDLKKRHDFRNIIIVREFIPDMPDVPMIVTEIEQVLLNLLKNAAQAMVANPPERPPRIVLRLKREERYAVVEVEDNGPGMPEEVRRRVFEPFFTTKPPGSGTGLGLSVSYMIVTRNHKGLMDVETVPGGGARFIVKLPLV